MTWFAFKGYNGGQAIDLAGVQEKEAAGLGFHGYATQAQAQQQPNSVNLLQAPLVNGFITDYNFAVKAGEQPGGPNSNILNPAADASGAASALGSFFGGSAAGWLMRGAEILLGLVLIAVGVAKLTRAVPIATAVARKVA